MSNAQIKSFADQLADVMMRVEDAKAEAAAIIDAAKDAGVDAKALRKVAKELVTDSDKLAKKYADEEQLDMFRGAVGIFAAKGLDTTDKAQEVFRKQGEQRLIESAKAFDAVAGSNIAGNYTENMGKLKALNAKRARSLAQTRSDT